MIQPLLLVEIDTFAPLAERRELSVAWAQRLRKELDELVGDAREGELDLVFADGRDRSSSYTQRSWKRAIDDLASGSLTYLALQLDGGGFELEAAPVGHPGAARRLTFRVPHGADAQKRVAELAKELAVAVEAATGYVTLDRPAGLASPFERAISADPLEARLHARELVLGYFWGTFLSGGHVERLGGANSVREEAPVLRVEELGPITFLQLTERVDDTPEDALRALRSYLAPLLPTGPGPAPFDPFPPLRVLPEDLEPRPEVEFEAEEEEVAPTPRGAALVFKHEDVDRRGRPVGPAILNEDDEIVDLGWMTLEQARQLAQERGWRFAED
jgi:hypothetical protein